MSPCKNNYVWKTFSQTQGKQNFAQTYPELNFFYMGQHINRNVTTILRKYRIVIYILINWIPFFPPLYYFARSKISKKASKNVKLSAIDSKLDNDI